MKVCTFSYIAASLLMVSIIQIECSDSGDNAEAKKSNSTIAVQEKKPPVHTTPFIPSVELSWKNEIGQILAVGGLVISGLVIIGTFVWLLGPIFGYKICTLLGTCEPEPIFYSSGGSLQEFGQPHVLTNNLYSNPYTGYYDSEHKKRSLDYLGPIIKTLATAYEKYDTSSTLAPKVE